MSDRSTTQMTALGLLVLTIFAIIVGAFNAASQQLAKNSVDSKAEDGEGVLSLIGSGGMKKDHLLSINISGPIFMDGPQQGGGLLSNDSMAVTARKALDKAVKDDSIKGVLLRINCPGGTVGMSHELNMAVQRVSKVKPVVASLGDVAASGAYYTAVAADKIVAYPGSITGSIGVILSGMNVKGLLIDKLGLKSMTIKSGKFKDILSPYRDALPEEVALIQHIINESYQQFLSAVITGRTRFITDEKEKAALTAKLKSIADGRVLVGTDAQKMGLVDEIGDLEYSKKLLSNMAKERFNLRGKEDIPVEEYENGGSLMALLGLSEWLHLSPAQQSSGAFSQLIPFSALYPNQPLWMME